MPTFTLNGKPCKPEDVGFKKIRDLEPEKKATVAEQMSDILKDPNYIEFVNGGSDNQSIVVEDASGEKIDAISVARKRLEKLKKQGQPTIEPFEYEGETFYVKHLSARDLIRLSVAVQRDCQGILQLHKGITPEEASEAAYMATLEMCLCEADGRPYFTREDIEEYIDNPAAVSHIAHLAEKCYSANPDILSTLKKS